MSKYSVVARFEKRVWIDELHELLEDDEQRQARHGRGTAAAPRIVDIDSCRHVKLTVE